jgi:hypothetical protein
VNIQRGVVMTGGYSEMSEVTPVPDKRRDPPTSPA